MCEVHKTEQELAAKGIKPKPKEHYPTEHACGKAARGRDCSCGTCLSQNCGACLEALY